MGGRESPKNENIVFFNRFVACPFGVSSPQISGVLVDCYPPPENDHMAIAVKSSFFNRKYIDGSSWWEFSSFRHVSFREGKTLSSCHGKHAEATPT